MSQREVGTLRAVVFRLSSSSTEQLPKVVSRLARVLVDCAGILSSEANQRKDTIEAVLLHKLRTRVNSLLNSRTQCDRWAAVVLIKTLVDVGGWQMLKDCRPWVQGVRSLISKHVPATTQRLCVITLTKIFLLTHWYPTLVREITTPEVQEYVKLCINRMTVKPSKTEAAASQHANTLCMLQSFESLLPLHPNVFRPFLPQLRGLLLEIMSAEASVQDPLLADNPLTSTAQRLFAMLHFSAPKSDKDEKKDGARKAWSTDFENLLVDAHKTADQVFRAVVEEWQSSCGVHVGFKTSDNDMLCQGPTQLGLNGFAGIQDGCSRLRRLLALAATFTVSRSSDPVDFPLARLVDMLTRLFLVVVPSSVNASENLRLNESMSDEETNALWTELPDIHVATLKCVSALCDRLGTSAVPVYAVLLEHVEWLFRRESYNVALRMSAYSAVANILHLVGVGLHRQSVRDLSPLMQVCCKDIVPPSREAKDDTNQLANTHTKRVTTSLNADTLFVVAKAGTEPLNPKNTDLETAALHLLATFLSKVPSRHIPPLLRATLDRTAILRQDKAAIFASCMNPPTHRSGEKSKASLLPLLTRLHPAALETEGLVRPRMPILFVGEQQGSDDEDYEEMHDVPMNQDLQGGSHDHSRRDQHVPEGSEIDLSHSIADTQNGVPKIPTQGHLPAGTDDTSYRPQNDPKDTLHQLSPRKRSSSSDVDGSAPAKRRRAAPLFGVPNIGDDGSTKAPPTEPVVIRNSTEASGKETVVTNHVPGIEEDAMNDDLDGSDDSGEFVIPPLTLASDSEDDEENEEEEREGEIGAAEDEELELDKEDHDEDLQNR